MMTAAGTITPAKVLIFGAGVAGLQAIATAKRLGAVVEVTDVRPETKEQVESLGGRFITVDAEGSETEGGYAKEVSKEFLEKQKALVAEKIKDSDLVITTALVFGKKAPVLISEDMVMSMKTGSVIVDMAVSQGGNCALSKNGEEIVVNGVTIIGEPNLPSLLATNASDLYGKNVAALILHLVNEEKINFDTTEEIIGGSLITHQGEIVNPKLLELLNQK
jgi:NAD(P) transhydrogenase subunit alpha